MKKVFGFVIVLLAFATLAHAACKSIYIFSSCPFYLASLS